jgi:4-hydroxy-tetrahydrodipicolinate reductase
MNELRIDIAGANRCVGLILVEAIDSAPEAVLAGADSLIDFISPEGALRHIACCARHSVKINIGTADFDDAGKAKIAAVGRVTTVFDLNMSVAANILLLLLEWAASSLFKGNNIETVEAHCLCKVDAQSGTAPRMGNLVAALGNNLKQGAVHDFVVMAAKRALEHQLCDYTRRRLRLLYACIGGERIEISYKSSSRTAYVNGAAYSVFPGR